MLSTGQAAPAWKCEDQDGALRTSEEFFGKYLLLYFYPKDDTPGCTAEACGFRDSYARLSPRIAIVGVSADSKENHKEFQAKYSLPFPLLADTSGTVIKLFGADGTTFPKRTTFLIDPQGVIRKIYRTVDCKGHAETIDEDLRALGL